MLLKSRIDITGFALLYLIVISLIGCGEPNPVGPHLTDPLDSDDQNVPIDGTVLTQTAGGKVTASDGASVELPANFGTGDTAIKLTKVTGASGDDGNGNDLVSGIYKLEISDLANVHSNLTVTLPVDKSLFDSRDSSRLIAEIFESASGSWIPGGTMLYYDQANGTVIFDLAPSRIEEVATISAKSRAKTEPEIQTVYIVCVDGNVESGYFTLTMPSSKFKLNYFTQETSPGNAVKADADWTGSGTYDTTDNVPNYLEDMDKALNTYYERILNLKKSGGESVFSRPSEPQTVWVGNVGGEAGDTQLGGPLKLSNSTIGGLYNERKYLTSYDDMRLIAAHELVHLLQSQYYTAWGTFTGWQNRWFIEAVATYFSAVVCGLTDEQKGECFGGQNGTPADYLNVPLNTNSEQNYYAVAHFFDWLTTKSSIKRDGIIADSLKTSGVSDLTNLSETIVSAGMAKGVNGAFDEYAEYVMTHPEGYGGFNYKIKASLMRFNTNPEHPYLERGVLTDTYTFTKISRWQTPLTVVNIGLEGKNTSDALLVISPKLKSTSYPVKSLTFDFWSGKDADYVGKTPIDKGQTFPYTKPLTIKNFGASSSHRLMEQILINPASSIEYEIAYYLLVAPTVIRAGNGSVVWKTSEIGNIPLDYLKDKGADVYDVYNENWKKLNTQPIGLPNSGTEQRFSDSRILTGHTLHVVVKDKDGNTWPEVQKEIPQSRTVESNVKIKQSVSCGLGKIDLNLQLPTTVIGPGDMTGVTDTGSGDFLTVTASTAIKSEEVRIFTNVGYQFEGDGTSAKTSLAAGAYKDATYAIVTVTGSPNVKTVAVRGSDPPETKIVNEYDLGLESGYKNATFDVYLLFDYFVTYYNKSNKVVDMVTGKAEQKFMHATVYQ